MYSFIISAVHNCTAYTFLSILINELMFLLFYTGNGKKLWHWCALPCMTYLVPCTDVHRLPCAVQVPCMAYHVAGVGSIFGKYCIMGFGDCKKGGEEWWRKLVYYLKNILVLLFMGKNWSWLRSFPFLNYLCLRYMVNITWSRLYGVLQ